MHNGVPLIADFCSNLTAGVVPMKLLFVHPGPLLYTNVFLRLEPLGLELVAEAARRGKHRLRELQSDTTEPRLQQAGA